MADRTGTCKDCGIEVVAKGKSGMVPWRCLTCNRKSKNATQRSYKTRQPDGLRAVRLRSLYGLTIEQWEAMHASQDGRCAICDKLPPEGQKLNVDHNHKTGQVRGLLCHHCNRGLGHFGDDPELLLTAAGYLRTYLPTE